MDYRVAIWRKALKKELFDNPQKNLCMLIGVMMAGAASNVSSTKLTFAFEAMTTQKSSHGNSGKAAAMVEGATEEVRYKMLNGIVISTVDGIDKQQLPDMLKFMQVDLAKHWKLKAEFLDLLTKSEIEVIAEELGLKTALGEKYAKAKSGKKDEFIKAMMGIEGFVYEGKISKVLMYPVD
jgi:ParB family chromosome partitioning protein